MSTEGFFLLLFFISASFFLISFALGEVFHGVDGALHGVIHDLFHVETPGAGDSDSVSPFSLRTIMIFLTGFAGVGYICIDAGVPGWLALILGTLVGWLAAWLIYQVLKYLARSSGGRNWRIDDAWGHEAEVIIRIEPEGLGKVLLTVKGQVINFPARSNSRTLIPQGTTVTIVDIDREQGVATVVPSGRFIP